MSAMGDIDMIRESFYVINNVHKRTSKAQVAAAMSTTGNLRHDCTADVLNNAVVLNSNSSFDHHSGAACSKTHEFLAYPGET